MQPPQDLRAAGDRIEKLVDSLRDDADVRTRDRVVELLRLVTELYGAGLARVVELAGATAPGTGRGLRRRRTGGQSFVGPRPSPGAPRPTSGGGAR